MHEGEMTFSGELKKTPLDSLHRDAGARMVEFAGWSMPVQYAGVMEEHRAVREVAGLFDVSHMGEIRISGPDAESFVQSATPNDVTNLTPGRVHYSALLTEQGTYIDDLLVYRLAASEFLLVVNAANVDSDLRHLGSLQRGDVEIRDVSSEYALLALQGPRALEILAPLADRSLADIGYYRFVRGKVAGCEALVSRTGYTGEDGFELYLDQGDAPAVWERLFAEGRAVGLTAAGLGARDTLRLEAGMALYGHEIDGSTTPWEAGLGWTVKLECGPFAGRDALVEQREKGIARKLVGFVVTDRGIARQGHRIRIDGEDVGAVTSGTYCPTLDRAAGMAYVAAALATPAREIEIEVRRRSLRGRLVGLPLYRRPRGAG
jgi:aminomethyltransferase